MSSQKWDKYYRDNPINEKVLPIVRKFYRLSPIPLALDIACGMGRNAIFLAKNGFCVDAVDISGVAVEYLERFCDINAMHSSISDFIIHKNHYGLVCNSYFLDRSLFTPIIDGLVKEGIVIFETFIHDDILLDPINPAFLLESNELLRVFSSLKVIFYCEKVTTHRNKLGKIAQLVAQKI